MDTSPESTINAPQSRDLPIINRKGLHARATAKFVQCCEKFDAVINVQGDMPFADPGLATACARLGDEEASRRYMGEFAALKDDTHRDDIRDQILLRMRRRIRRPQALGYLPSAPTSPRQCGVPAIKGRRRTPHLGGPDT